MKLKRETPPEKKRPMNRENYHLAFTEENGIEL